MKDKPIKFEPEFNLIFRLVLLVKENPVWVTLTILLIGIVGAMYIQFQFQQAQISKIQQAVAPNESQIVIQKFESDKKINAILEDLRVELDADRAKVFQYHNSQKGITGVPFLFISATNEVTKRGVSSEINRLQRLPASVFNTTLSHYFDKKTLCFTPETVGEESAKQLLNQQAIVISCNYPIVFSNDIMGIVTVNYNSNKIIDESKINLKMQVAALRISDALEVNK